MVIRWNTMFAEMRRARNLSPVRTSYQVIFSIIDEAQALDAFVADMARGLTGKAKAAALASKKKWEMRSSDWEFIDKLMNALEARIFPMLYPCHL